MKLKNIIYCICVLVVIACGSDDPTGSNDGCTNASCSSPPAPFENIIGSWTVREGEEDEGTVTFNADMTGMSSTLGAFALFDNGDRISDFTWSFNPSNERFTLSYQTSFGQIGLFYSVLDNDCGDMQLQDRSTISNVDLIYDLCRS